MKAKLTINMAGSPMRRIGELVEGKEAERLVEAGFAEAIEEAPTKPKKETAAKKTAAKETSTK